MQVYFLIFLSIVFSSASSLANTVTLSVAESATAIPQKLINDGINNVGPIDLPQLVNDIKTKIRFAVLPVFSIGAGTYGSVRSGSSCHVEDHTVYVNQPHLDSIGNLGVIEALLLHESLCALGFNDDNYMISSTLGFLRRISERPDDGGPSDAEKLISSQNFISPFIRRLATRTRKQVYEIPTAAKPSAAKSLDKRQMLERSGGTVTGVGGGGDGFALHLKMLLFENFYAYFSLCQERPSESRITLPQDNSSAQIFDIDVICFEPRLSTWWNYFFALSTEIAYMKASSKQSIEIPDEMPALGSFIIEPKTKDPNSNELLPIKITVDSYRWSVTGNLWNDQSATTIFMAMMLNYYPAPNARTTQKYPVFEFKGKKENVDAVMKTFSYATAAKCIDPAPDRNMGASFISMPLSVYVKDKADIPLNKINEPPNCVYLLD